MGPRVGIVFVSHSAKIAEGLVELAGQMAADTTLIPAGGTDDGSIGTSFERIATALRQADAGAGVVVLCDLGSAIMTAETALDFAPDEARARVRIVDAPLVEGGVAAAVSAQGGGDLGAVVAAARSALGPGAAATDPATEPLAAEPEPEPGSESAAVALINPEGLHARPAADFVKLASTFDAAVTVNGVDARSLLRIMALGLTQGDSVQLTATGPEAAAAVAALRALVQSGFGEA